MSHARRTLDGLARRSRAVTLFAGLLALGTLALVAYLRATGTGVTEPRYLLYPVLWIAAGVTAVAWTEADARAVGSRGRALAAAVAVGYFLALAYLDGSVGTAPPLPPTAEVVVLPPGWGPALLVRQAGVQVTLLPFKAVGYAALAYLVYAVLLDTVGPAVGGALGLASCVSCVAPGVSGVLSAVLGTSSGVVTVATTLSYDVSTAIFLATLALLYYRPFEGFGTFEPPDHDGTE